MKPKCSPSLPAERGYRALACTGTNGVYGAIEFQHSVVAFNPAPALAKYREPTLAVITPANDYPYSMHRVGQGLPHRVITGTGHWLQIERPAEFNRIVERFLAGEV